MRTLRQLEALVGQLPVWGQILLAAFLVLFSVASVYGRINPRFGAKVFSRIPEDQIQTNVFHIVWYTVFPVVATLLLLTVLLF